MALNGISRVMAPFLHSASLRSYVMVIVLTSMVVGGVALFNTGLGLLVPKTSVSWHELPVLAVIIAGAIAATLAKSTMAAVLSLGAVGYGVATMFLMYGAPDLAMTQFSVETLTVIIYVLVFRHFRALDQLSPRLVRFRDALIAVGIGTLIGGLVLSVATTETAPRLREFFAEFGPTLGHGRNIVNVILVDFRAFDTLAEITVLATAAIGVRALLRLASAERPTPRAASSPPVTSTIFRTSARVLMPLLLLFSVFLLFRGHNEPGGGFVGGLVAASAFALFGIASGVERARQALLVKPLTLLGVGLLIALISGLPAVALGQPFLTAQWLLGPVAIGSPAVFDTGVFLVVLGVVLMMIFTLAEEA
jgi:multicomponent Na+:H+ antiporter subunit A